MLPDNEPIKSHRYFETFTKLFDKLNHNVRYLEMKSNSNYFCTEFRVTSFLEKCKRKRFEFPT